MKTDSLIVEYVIIVGVGLLPFAIILFIVFNADLYTLKLLVKEVSVIFGGLYLFFSYVIGIFFDLFSRGLLKNKERTILRKILLSEFSDRLGIIVKCNAAIAEKYNFNQKIELTRDDSKFLLRDMRYKVYERASIELAHMIGKHNHMKRISRAMAVILPILSMAILLALTLHRMPVQGFVVSGLVLLLAIFYYIGFKRSVRSYVRTIVYSWLAINDKNRKELNEGT